MCTELQQRLFISLHNDKNDGADAGISLEVDALKADLFERSF